MEKPRHFSYAMKSFQKFLLLLGGLAGSASLQAQNYDTPPFNFDRNMERGYVDSLLRRTRTRLLYLDRLRPSPSVDTARLELLHFMAYVHYSRHDAPRQRIQRSQSSHPVG